MAGNISVVITRLRMRWFRLTHWEFWSFNAIYLPIVWYYGWLAVKARGLFFFSAANPEIEYGGFLMESKYKIYQQSVVGTFPESYYIPRIADFEHAQQHARRLGFPLIAKPDIGARGRGVAILHNEEMLQHYHTSVPVDYLLQQLVTYANEIGIFYVRHPDASAGRITGIVEKQMLTVTGDNKSSIKDLLFRSKRFAIYAPAVLKQMGDEAQRIPAADEEVVLVPFGNHARGATFINATHKVNPQLLALVEQLCSQIPQFHYGRLDIRFNSWDDLYAGRNFCVIEVNGAGSEPTHMYDPSNSLFTAWSTIINHWRELQAVSVANRKRGYPYLSFRQGLAMMRASKRHDKLLDPFIFHYPKQLSEEAKTA